MYTLYDLQMPKMIDENYVIMYQTTITSISNGNPV